MTNSTAPITITSLPSELIDAIFLHLDIKTLSKIHLQIPSLKSRAATALDTHIKSLTLTLGSLDSTTPVTLRCDKTLSTSRYLYYFRFFTNNHFSRGSFRDDDKRADEDGPVALALEGGVQSAYLRRLMERVEEKELE
ncbi:hypothetical protein HK097_005163, partial [Rhizophlyctis rosea]